MRPLNIRWIYPRHFVPAPRPPLRTHMQRLCNGYGTQNLVQTGSRMEMSQPNIGPNRRRPLRSIDDDSSTNIPISQSTKLFNQAELDCASDNESSDYDSIEYDRQVTNSSSGSDNKETSHYFSPESRNRNRSRTTSLERSNSDERNKSRKKRSPSKPKLASADIKQNTNSYLLIIIGVLISIISVYIVNIMKVESTKEKSFTNNRNLEIFTAIEKLKTKFYNQEPDIWNDISSGINEVKTSNPQMPSIILLFANETRTMDCLALALADVSNTVLGGDSPLHLEPKAFGNDPGEIISTLKKTMTTKKAVIIRDVLSINAEAIKALHNLCDRVNPLIREAIYIITMQTKNYKSSQKKMTFVENQIYRKLSKNIDKDILMALVTRITDGAIISVQPQPDIQRCS